MFNDTLCCPTVSLITPTVLISVVSVQSYNGRKAGLGHIRKSTLKPDYVILLDVDEIWDDLLLFYHGLLLRSEMWGKSAKHGILWLNKHGKQLNKKGFRVIDLSIYCRYERVDEFHRICLVTLIS